MKKFNKRALYNVMLMSLLLLSLGGCASLVNPPMHNAASKGDINTVKRLLDEGENVDEWYYGTPLIFASSGGHMEMVKLLVEKGANIDARMKFGPTPLGQAILSKRIDIAKYLIKKGADINNAIVGLNDIRNNNLQYSNAENIAAAENAQKAIDELKILQLNVLLETAYNNYQKGEYQKSINISKHLISISPSPHQDYYAILAGSYQKLNQFENALIAAKMSIEIKENMIAYTVLGDIDATKKKYDKAAFAYKKAIELAPNNTYNYSVLASVYMKTKNYKDALVIYKKGLIIAPYDVRVNLGLARFYMITKKYDKAIIVLDKFIVQKTLTSSELSSFLARRSLAYRAKLDFKNAAIDAKKAYSLDITDYSTVAFVFNNINEGKYDKALQVLSSARKDANFVPILESTIYAKRGDFKKAISIYSAIPEKKSSPENINIWSGQSNVLNLFKPFVTSQIESAVEMKTQGKYEEALNELGALLKIANDETMLVICKSIYEIISTNPKSYKLPEEARKHVIRGDMSAKRGDLEKAIYEYTGAINSAPYIAHLYFNKAMIYGKLKKYSQAIRYTNIYLNLAPKAPNFRALKDQVYKWELMLEE